jgi:hypothetical protein
MLRSLVSPEFQLPLLTHILLIYFFSEILVIAKRYSLIYSFLWEKSEALGMKKMFVFPGGIFF